MSEPSGLGQLIVVALILVPPILILYFFVWISRISKNTGRIADALEKLVKEKANE